MAFNVQVILDELASVASQCLHDMDLENPYHLIQALGNGGYGSVLMVKEKTTGQPMAMKLLNRNKTTESSFLRELSMAFFLSSHPNIVDIYGVGVKTCNYFGYTQELATHGDLFDLIPPNEGLPEEIVKRCATQISSALDFMESEGLVHLDIKPENILVFDKDCHLIKITDFGLTRVKGTITTRWSGTKSYMAPEMRNVTDENPLVIDSSLDAWSFGVVLYYLLTGTYPWQSVDKNDQEYYNFVGWQKDLGRMDPPAPWRRFPPVVLTMLCGLLAIDYNRRSKCTEVLMFLEQCWKDRFSENNGADDMNKNLSEQSCPASIPHMSDSTTSNLGVNSFYLKTGSSNGEKPPHHQTDIVQYPSMFIDDEISVYVGAEVEIG
ncbi:serine/threonine-protein kinase SBK1-like [Dendropsophus ebraccatus]|uniref:serine/threonine-protein kinase SBK1-like n=1 Tax=Dendropsophus ebraccatus TaxID=150705 RepID=UPI0038318A01